MAVTEFATGQLALLFQALVDIENEVFKPAVEADGSTLRVYDLTPETPPELPAIWNDVEDGSYENVDTARADDIIIVSAMIAVHPVATENEAAMRKLLRLTDLFRFSTAPYMRGRTGDLKGTVRRIKRITTRTAEMEWEKPTGEPFQARCMEMLFRAELTTLFE